MKHLKRAIFIVSYFFTISTILFVLVNLASVWIIAKKSDRRSELLTHTFQYLLYEAYQQSVPCCNCDSGYVTENLSNLLNLTESNKGEYEYMPAIEFNSRAYKSKHLNIIANPFDLNYRSSLSDSAHIAERYPYAVYCFGGSTTFGSLVSDSHTWPAFLQIQLNQADENDMFSVKNYGTSGYTPTQETEKFLQLLKLGHRPSVAVFMDGVNTGPVFDGSEFSRGIAERFETNQNGPISLMRFVMQLPVFRLIRQSYNIDNYMEGDSRETYPFEADSSTNRLIVSRFKHNARLRNVLGQMYGVKVINILQPSTYVKYNYSYLKPAQNELITDEVKRNYRYLYADLKKDSLFIDLSSLFDEYGKPAVVDGLHYSPGFNNFLAKSIVPFINFKELNNFKLDTATATGVSF